MFVLRIALVLIFNSALFSQTLALIDQNLRKQHHQRKHRHEISFHNSSAVRFVGRNVESTIAKSVPFLNSSSDATGNTTEQTAKLSEKKHRVRASNRQSTVQPGTTTRFYLEKEEQRMREISEKEKAISTNGERDDLFNNNESKNQNDASQSRESTNTNSEDGRPRPANKVAQLPRGECRLRHVSISIKIPNCGRISVNTTACGGKCKSSEQLIPNTLLLKRTCSACKAHIVNERKFKVKCVDNSFALYKLNEVGACTCFKHSDEIVPVSSNSDAF